jgi:transaldolase
MAMIYCSGITANPALIDAARQLAANNRLDADTMESIQHKVNRIAARRVLHGLLRDPTNDA